MQITLVLCLLSASSALRLPEKLKAGEEEEVEAASEVIYKGNGWGVGTDGWATVTAANSPLAKKVCDGAESNKRKQLSNKANLNKPDPKCDRAEEDRYITTLGNLDTQFELVKEMKGMGFNAAIEKLPLAMAAKLAKGATWLYIPKLSHNQCAVTCANDHGTKWWVDNDSGTLDKDYVSAIYVLDNKFEVIHGPVMKLLAEDMRALVVGDQLMVDYHYKGSNWEIRAMDLDIDNCGDLVAEMKAVHWGNYDWIKPGAEAQNIQMIPHKNSLYSIWWENQTAVTEIRKIEDDGTNNPVDFARKEEEIQVKGSAHPLFLPEAGAYLGTAHYSRKQMGDSDYFFGSEYVQFWTLHDADPPFNVMKRTKDFCFGSFDKPDKCEIIQFVSSLTRFPWDPNMLLVSVGIHDCRSLLLKVPLNTILDAMESPKVGDATPALSFARVK